NLFHAGGSSGEDGFGQDLNAGVGTGGIDPFAALHGELNREHSVDLLTVRVTSPDGSVGRPGGVQPFYLRTNVLSSFRGDGWRPGPDGASEPADGSQFPSAPGTEFAPRTSQFSADITVSGLRSNPPVFASPTSLSGVSGSTSWNTRNMLLIDSTVDSGQVIHEEVSQPQPTVNDLRAATAPDPAMSEWLRLPKISAYVRDLTARITAQAGTPYDRARAISSFFGDPRNGFSYSLQTATGDSGDELTDFLQKRTGFCQQYAASMGVMLRLAGVPARVVLGYAHNLPGADGTFTVTTFDAHAWVEAYFTGVGWVPFDPTPLAGISGGASSDLVWAPHGKVDNGRSNVVPSHEPTQPTATATGQVAPRASGGSRDSGVSFVVPLAVLALLAILAVVALTPASVRWQRRRRRMYRIRAGDTDALWAELSDTAVDLGYVWSDARSPRQVARWLGSSSDVASGSLQTLTRAVEQARYRPRAAAGTRADLADELEIVRRGLGARRSPRERLRARFWPASLNWSQLPVLGRWLPGEDAPRHR
ncbi:MAG: transglutaminase TgpA family protein, partial [Jatrophihabitantaceae bacterium]